MPKDTEKYQYFTVGFERDSWALARLKADAKKHHMSDQPGKLVALRLTDYYELLERGVLQAALSVPLASPPGNGSTSNDHSPSSREHTRTDSGLSTQEDIVDPSEHAEQNADEALDYWGTL